MKIGQLRNEFEELFDKKEKALAKSELDAKLADEALDVTMEGFLFIQAHSTLSCPFTTK